MSKTLARLAVLIAALTALSGCVPVAIGAVGAVAIDSASEDRGRDLF
ncbi:hypothetical protein [Boseongicola aestuarii]|jgi:hypothetical protein|uniref:Lipoprotein n=1 Tax=Boseongicola aestuarii TaxID=1470561 RepID=A0A238J400_9RHOB|nr:hypothetical protein [Boseongicola aestuarii]SMX24634.1 hypothetical protein BOA8489_02760 [Boseongicola aestuarii]